MEVSKFAGKSADPLGAHGENAGTELVVNVDGVNFFVTFNEGHVDQLEVLGLAVLVRKGTKVPDPRTSRLVDDLGHIMTHRFLLVVT